jgi:hypothetical protein
MDGHRFDALTRALATGTSRRQALKSFLGTAVGLGLVAQGLNPALAASNSASTQSGLARTSADLLSRMDHQAAGANVPSDVRAAGATLRQLLADGTQAQSWNSAQLQAFAARVDASVLQFQLIAQGLSANAPANSCTGNCVSTFQRNLSHCGTEFLGRLLCRLIAVVDFDLCIVACSL